MSRKLAGVLYHTAKLTTLPMTNRLRNKTKATLAARLSGDLNTRLETRHGSLRILSERGGDIVSALNGFATDEPETMAWIDTMQPGDVFWDIGANIGLYSMYAALRGGLDIYAFEPSGLNYGLMVEHLQINKLDRAVNVLCVALGEETGVAKLMCSSGAVGHASNSIGDSANQFGEFSVAFQQAVPAFRVDDLCSLLHIPQPTHVKLDVDGIEAMILRGSPETFGKIKSLMVEVEGDEARKQDILSQIASFGLVEETSNSGQGQCRNRLFVRRA